MSAAFRRPFFAVEDGDGIVHFTGMSDFVRKGITGAPLPDSERVSSCGMHRWDVPWDAATPTYRRTGKDISCLGCLAAMPAKV
jgi:hypothetical protein